MPRQIKLSSEYISVVRLLRMEVEGCESTKLTGLQKNTHAGPSHTEILWPCNTLSGLLKQKDTQAF